MMILAVALGDGPTFKYPKPKTKRDKPGGGKKIGVGKVIGKIEVRLQNPDSNDRC